MKNSVINEYIFIAVNYEKISKFAPREFEVQDFNNINI